MAMQDVPGIHELIEIIRAGDLDAYRTIVHHYHRDVLRVVALLLRNINESEEMVQQTFVEAYRSLDRYRSEEPFGKWVCGIARNRVLAELRQRRRQHRLLDRYQAHLEKRLVADQAFGTDTAQQRHALLKECMASLPEASRRILMLRYEESQSHQEISERIGRTVVATEKFLSRLRIQLRQCITTKMNHA